MSSPENLIDNFKTLTKSIPFIHSNLREFFIEDNESFINIQHDFLSKPYVVVDLKENILRVVTMDNKSFLINLETVTEDVYSVIFSVHYPRKICVDSKVIFRLGSFPKESIYDINLIMKLFYANNDLTLEEIFNFFYAETAIDENVMLSSLFAVKDKLNIFLEKNRLMKLLNSETRILEIVSNCEAVGLPCSSVAFEEFRSTIKKKNKETSKNLESRFGVKIKSLSQLLEVLSENELPPSLDEYLLEFLGELELLEFVISSKLLDKYKGAFLPSNGNRLHLSYNSYDEYCSISPNYSIDRYYIEGDKRLITGSYRDLFWRVFAEKCNSHNLIDSVNRNSFFTDLAMTMYGSDNGFAQFNTKSILSGYIKGYRDPSLLVDYFLNELFTQISDDEVNYLLNGFSDNCNELKSYIDSFNCYSTPNKRHIKQINTPLYSFLRAVEADIFKEALLLINDSVLNYNINNKSKIKIITLFDNSIVLEADNRAVNTAVDILNRNLTKAYSKHLKKVQVMCRVNVDSRIKL